ncbi:MAG: hypothetical protein U0264_00005 [Candidatus Kapaibacterium sp.]
MKLIGLNDRIGVVDVGAIATQELLNTLKKLPEGNAVQLIKQMPESVLTQICTQGVNEKITAYIPVAVAGAGVGIVVGMKTKSLAYGLLSALFIGGIVYLIRQPQTSQS